LLIFPKKPIFLIKSPIIFDLEKNEQFETEHEVYMITKQLRVKEIVHNVLPMEYPPTSEDGIAIIYNIEAWDNFEAFTDNVSIYF